MSRRSLRCVVVAALCLGIGLHAALFQSLAWATMMVGFAKHHPLAEAVAQSFDGNHPCNLCHAVARGQNQQKKPESPAAGIKVELICSISIIQLTPQSTRFSRSGVNVGLSSVTTRPLVPPPRLIS